MTEVKVCGLRFLSSPSPEKAAELFTERLPHGAAVFTPNAEIMHKALRNRIFYNKLAAADFLLPDGQGIAVAARLHGKRIRRSPGVDVGLALIRSGCRTYLFGGREGVAARAAERLQGEFSEARIVGYRSGYYGDTEEKQIVAEIVKAKPEVVLVCLGSPRQEEWILRNRLRFPESVLIGLGGSIDVYAGDVRRAPRLLQNMGLEWAYRVFREPKRLPRLASLPLFIAEAYLCAERERFRRGIPPLFPSNCTKIRKNTPLNEKNVRI